MQKEEEEEKKDNTSSSSLPTPQSPFLNLPLEVLELFMDSAPMKNVSDVIENTLLPNGILQTTTGSFFAKLMYETVI
jgi:hypothetical protein